jgi:hypothetical protein
MYSKQSVFSYVFPSFKDILEKLAASINLDFSIYYAGKKTPSIVLIEKLGRG